MFLDGRLGIGFDSNVVSLRVLKIGDCIVGGFYEEESVASVRRCRIVGRQMETHVSVERNELFHDDWPVG